ncbi:MAG: lactate racemase domain-containing protein [Lacipirellulaceae bacterium]
MKFQFGEQQAVELANDPRAILGPSSDEVVADLAAEVRLRLAAPLDFPPLAATTVPGDTAAIALGRGVPQPEQVVLGAIAALLDAGVEPTDIAVVSCEKFAAERDLAQGIDSLGASGVKFVLHEPEQEESTAMVGVMRDDEPLRFNCALAEADFVLPIGTTEPTRQVFEDAEPTPTSKFASLYPHFSDEATQTRFQKTNKKLAPKSRRKLFDQQEEAGWLLGVLSTIQIIPGRDNQVSAVVVGEAGKAAEAAASAMQTIWSPVCEETADLVVAAMPGSPTQQTWENLDHALAAAERVVSPSGSIALLCEINEKARGSLRRLRDADDLAEVERKLMRDEDPTAGIALRLVQAIARGPVYLMSKLPKGEVESLGMTPIASEAELKRLIGNHESTIVIEEAHRLVPQVSIASVSAAGR